MRPVKVFFDLLQHVVRNASPLDFDNTAQLLHEFLLHLPDRRVFGSADTTLRARPQTIPALPPLLARAGCAKRLQSKLDPKLLAKEAGDGAKRLGDKGVVLARDNQSVLAGLAGDMLLYLIRKPLFRLFKRRKGPKPQRAAKPSLQRLCGREFTADFGDRNQYFRGRPGPLLHCPQDSRRACCSASEAVQRSLLGGA